MNVSICKVLMLLLFISVKPLKMRDESFATKKQIFNITCDPNMHSQLKDCDSKSLETIASETKENTNVQINIKTPLLRLTTNISFVKLHSLIITGDPNGTTILCSAGGNISAGIVVTNVMYQITLSMFRLSNCGVHNKGRPVYHDHGPTFVSALTILRCYNIELNGVVIAKNRGIGLSILSHQGGEVNITSTIFRDNSLSQDYQTLSVMGGGGLSVVLNQQNQARAITFHIHNCSFENNTSHTLKYRFGYTNEMGEVEEGYGNGGGVHFSIKNGLQNISVLFSNCKFIGNQAFIGGGLALKTYGARCHNKTYNVTVEIRDSILINNGCSNGHYTYNGGGAHLSFGVYSRSGETVMSHIHYTIVNVSFIDNCAELGGGVFYLSDRGRQGFSHMNNSVIFDNCTFQRNGAHIGSAVSMTPDMFLKRTTGYSITPEFNNCLFSKNSIVVSQPRSQVTQKTPGIGTIYVSLYNLHFYGSNRFEHNLGTALYIVNGLVNCTCSKMKFIGNTGIHGGAIALVGSSTMIVGPNTYEFINNTAIHQGGAIYVSLTDSTDFISSSSCFIQYHDADSPILSINWKANITFTGNHALDDTAGHAIHATSLHPCQVVNNGTEKKSRYILVNISEIFAIRGISFDDDPLRPQVGTDGALFHTSRPTSLKIIPGEKYHHNVTLTDDLGQSINASLRVAITRNQADISLNSGHYTYIGSEIQLRGTPEHNASLFMYTVSPRQSYIKLDFQLVECPPGFKLNGNSICTCNKDAYMGLFKCNLDNFHSYLHPGYWAGLVQIDTQNGSNMVLVTSSCPFCDYSLSASNKSSSFEIALPQSYTKLSESVCGETRIGTVCGKCQENYTMHFHSPGFLCKPADPAGCKLGWLLYILTELVPITLAFIIVLVFNISFTSGSVNGFILFVQLFHSLDINASGIIVLPFSVTHALNNWKQGYQVIYGFFNLDFFNSESLSFCLWNEATALDILAVKYVTILYTLLLIAVVIWIMNSCGGRCCGNYFRITTVKTSVIHGMSTFLVIGYAQCVKVSLYLLMPVHFFHDKDARVSPPIRVWLNGEVEYFSKSHLPYALPALVCLFTVGLLPPVLLFSYPLLNKTLTLLGCEDMNVVVLISQRISISSLKPLLDSIQGCFKDNFRFFAGLYFIYRWTILLIHMNPSVFGVYYTAVGGVLLFILTLHTVCQPYVKRVYNIVDALLFVNLVAINFLSFFNYHSSRAEKEVEQGATVAASIVQLVLIYLPIVVMGAYVIMVYLCKGAFKHGYENLLAYVFTPERVNRLREQVQGTDHYNDDDDEFVHERLLA